MKRLALVLALVTASCTETSVDQGFLAVNRFRVAEIGNATFETIASGSRVRPADYWCAAGDYGRARGLPTSRRVFLVSPEGLAVSRENRRAVQFTFDPAAAGITPVSPRVSLSVRVVGDNMSITSATQYCLTGRDRFF